MRVHLRRIIRRDLPEVLEIERLSFDIAWTEKQICQVLSKRAVIVMVAELDERVVGFMIFELHEESLHLVEFAVHPEFRRQGVGRQMVEKLKSKLTVHRRTLINLHVRERSLEAQLFYKIMGFKAIEVVREYYEHEGQDAYLMEYALESEPALAG